MHAYVSRSRAPRSRRRVEPQLDLTPLVDVAFLLLTFFMFASTMSRPNMMRIPVPGWEGTASRASVLTIYVDRDGSLLYSADDQARFTPVERGRVGDLATRWRSERSENLTTVLATVVKAHPQARLASVVSTVDDLRRALARPGPAVTGTGDSRDAVSIQPITPDERKRLEEL